MKKYVLLFLLLMPTMVHAATIFTEDYEVANLEGLRAKGWWWIGPLDGDSWSSPGVCLDYCALSLVTITSTGAPPHGGSKMILLEYRGLHEIGPCCALWDNHNQRLMRSISPAQSEVYARYYFRTELNNLTNAGAVDPAAPSESNYFGGSSKQHYLKTDGTGYPDFTTNHHDPTSIRAITVEIQGISDSEVIRTRAANIANVPLQDNRWYCIEYHVKWGTPTNGILETWIDGQLTQQFTNVDFMLNGTTITATGLNLVNVYRQGANYQNRYEDDFVMATTRVGCGTPPPPDTTPPTVPSGLSVQ